MSLRLLPLLLLLACTGDPADTETPDATDDTDQDTAVGDDLALDLSSEDLVLAPGESITVPFTLINAPVEVGVDASTDIEGCVSADITGVSAGEPLLRVTGGSTFLGDCVLTVEAYGPGGDTDSVQIGVTIDVDWEGAIRQWGDGGVSRIGGLRSHAGGLLVAASVESVETPGVSLERRDGYGERTGVARVEGEAWDGSVRGVTASGQRAWIGVSDAQDRGWVVPVDGGTAGSPWQVVDLPGEVLPTAPFVDGSTVRLVGEVRGEDRKRGIFFAQWSLDGSAPTRTTFFAPGDGIRPSAVVRIDGGWRIGGLAYGTPFPEVEDGVEWGSYLADFDDDGGLIDVQRVGIENTQIQHIEVLEDGRTVIGGFLRNVDLDGESTTTRFDGFLQVFAADGSVAWGRTYGGEGDERLSTFRILDGTIVAGGQQEDAAWALGASLEDGSVQWEESWGEDVSVLSVSTVHGRGVVFGGLTTESLAGELSGTADRFLLRIGADGSAR